MAVEVNFDSIVGPTHNYAGLAVGNVASINHAKQISNPQAAALQGLDKMQRLLDLGIKQAVLPPPLRPNLAWLQQLGFSGNDEQIIMVAYKKAPQLLAAAYSAAAMWAANAATVSPSADTADGKVHFTAANLFANLHRSHESDFTAKMLKIIFNDTKHFVHHSPLPAAAPLSDEGAANHNRLCLQHQDEAFEIFVYGFNGNEINTRKFKPRQGLLAQQAIARNHHLKDDRLYFLQQNPAVIDAGVFHNDVIAVVNENVMLYHQQAFVADEQWQQLQQQLQQQQFYAIEISADELTVKDAVATYLFNSQLITLHPGKMLLLAPIEVAENEAAKAVVEKIIADDNPIAAVEYINCRQSMQNGGGPACMRLRVVLTATELQAVHQPVLLNNEKIGKLRVWVKQHYRDKIAASDLADPSLYLESQQASLALSSLLGLSEGKIK